MHTSQHTAIKVGPRPEYIAEDALGRKPAVLGRIEDEEWRDRIIASVNACAGIGDPQQWIESARAVLRQVVADLSAGEAIKYATFHKAEKLIANN